MLTHIIQTDSPTSYDDALNRALVEAATYATEMHDAQVALTDLSFREESGYHCEVEVTLSSVGLVADFDETTGQFKTVEPEDEDEQDYRVILTKGRETLRKIIEDFLENKTYVNLAQLPDFILSHIKPEDLLNKIVMHDFQEAVEPETIDMIAEFTEALEAGPEPVPVIASDDEMQPEPE